MATKITIIGAGPCGILLAHYLLRRGHYQVDIYDRRSDPRLVPFATYRTYPLALYERGLYALRSIPGLEEAVKEEAVAVTGSVAHFNNGKSRYIPRNKPMYTIDRTTLTIALLNRLTEQYDYPKGTLRDRSQVKIHFDCQCTRLDLQTKTVYFQHTNQTESNSEFAVNYDLLIGADGVRSVVRNSLLNTKLFEIEQKYLTTGYKTLYLANCDRGYNFEPGKIYAWSLQDGTQLLAVPQPDQTVTCVFQFTKPENFDTAFSSVEEVLAFFQKHFPAIRQNLSEQEAKAFLDKPVSRIMTILCNPYHYDDSVLILGDAAHAVSPSLGQGCNSAMEDVVILERLLDEYEDNWTEVLTQFSLRRIPDTHALCELSTHAFPLSKSLIVEWLLRRKISKTMHQLFPKYFPLYFSERAANTMDSYSEILNSAQGWINKVKRENKKVLEKL
jgi:kynurenine 3-monooxygenase